MHILRRTPLPCLLLLLAFSAAPGAALTAPLTGTAETVGQHLAVMQPLAAPYLSQPLSIVYEEDEPELGKRVRLQWQSGLFRQERDWLGLPECYAYDGQDYWYGSVEMLPVRLDHAEPADVSHQWAACLYYCADDLAAYLRPLTEDELSEARKLPQLGDWLLLAWTPPQMSEIWLLLDPDSLLLGGYLYGDKRELDTSSVIRLSLFDEWASFDDAAYPVAMNMLTVLSNGSEVRRRPARTVSVTRTDPLPLESFRTASTPPVPSSQLPGGKLELAFRLHDDDITLSATGPDGSELALKFDTGANIGLLRRDIAARFGWQPQGALPVSGHGGSADLQFLRAGGISLGGVELAPYTCGVMPGLNGPLPGEPGYEYHEARIADEENSLDSRLREEGIDGLLGTSLLNSFVVHVDYPARKLTLYDPAVFDAREQLAPGYLDLPLHRDALPFTEVTVDSKLSGGAFFNTGARPYFNLALWALDEHKIMYPIESIATGMSIHGLQVFGIIRPGVVALGELELIEPYTFLESLAPGDEPDSARMASFGSEFFHEHAVTFDLHNKRVYIEPR